MRRVLRVGALGASLLALAAASVRADSPAAGDAVGARPDGSYLNAHNQFLTPAGVFRDFDGSATGVVVRPGGGTAVVHQGDTDHLHVIDLPSGRELQLFDGSKDIASYDGVAYSPDGRTLLASGASGTMNILAVDGAGRLGNLRQVSLPKSGKPLPMCCDNYPGGIAIGPAGTAYVALSRNNTLGVIDVAAGTLAREIAVGNAPHSVLLDGATAYVSNEGGRPAQPGETTNGSAGTQIVSDPFTGAAITGTVSVVDLAAASEVATINVGLHPTAMARLGGYLFVCNTDSDSISVIDLTTRRVVQSIPVKLYDGLPGGAAPNGITALPGNRVAVTVGHSNAVAVYQWRGAAAAATLEGLVPTAWYPTGVDYDAGTSSLVISSELGIGLVNNRNHSLSPPRGSVEVVRLPSAAVLAAGIAQVARNNGWLASILACPGALAAPPSVSAAPPAPAAVPARPGDPSLINHVVYIVKENRSYDAILGDIGRGNSDPKLVQFPRAITPNQHALADQFVLFDNYYNSGRRSNDGHQWAMQGTDPDYFEKADGHDKRGDVINFTPPSSGFDALLYASTGFIWENALRHGKTFEDYGEYTSESQPPPARADKPSLSAHIVREFPGFELTTPDQVRAGIFKRHLAIYEQQGSFPNLVTLTLPDDHTGGTNPLYPTPESELADNDYGVGLIIEALSRSSFWKDTAVFVEQDDPGDNPDHVDGRRSTLFIASPYARRGIIDSHYYSQLSVLHTVELMLGLPPMNQLDMAAAPIRAAFMDSPRTADFSAITPAGTPVMNPPVASVSGMRREWAQAMVGQDFKHRDSVNPELLKRDVWYSVRGWNTPFPGDRRVLHPAEALVGHEDGPAYASAAQAPSGCAAQSAPAVSAPLPNTGAVPWGMVAWLLLVPVLFLCGAFGSKVEGLTPSV